ncbi:MAG: DNA/RNA non-specific endonuclease [Lachnospiraceae bacterium]|nr:DNA/RNA non-specific endonuclease [Lachnospiraceae bacterium]
MRNPIILLLNTLIILCLCSCSINDASIQQYSDSHDSASAVTLKHKSEIISYSPDSIPPYSGDAYIEINNNIPFFNDTTTTEPFEKYSPLDKYGRCGVAFANICPELMPDKPRGPIGMIKPSGWHTVKYNGWIEGNYLYNRCHLIAYELASENANELNLITGTRYMNTQGMLPFENLVAEYVNNFGNHVLYRVTPVFTGDNPVADGVLMEGYSVEDKGAGIQFCIYCYNVQPYIEIDYTTGDSRLIGDDDVVDGDSTNATTQPIQNSESTTKDYVLNTNTRKFHYPFCASVDDIKAHNRSEYTGSRDYLIEQGYTPCHRCNP